MPGPRGWPIIGSLLSLGESPHIALMQIASDYGNVFQIRLGVQNIVVLNGVRALRDALFKQPIAFSGRPRFPSFMKSSQGGKGLAFSSYSEQWRKLRKVVDASLRDFVTDRLFSTEQKITTEASELIRILTNNMKGHVMDAHDDIHVAIGNIIVFALFGKNYSHDDPEFKDLVCLNKQFAQAVTGNGNIADFFPWLQFVPSSIQDQLDTYLEQESSYMKDRLREHYNVYKSSAPRDILDRILSMYEVDEGRASLLKNTDSEKEVIATLSNLFGAGYDTTSKTLYISLVYMIIYPDIQRKVHEEIDRVVGRDRLPKSSDRPSMPFTDAVIQEVLRDSSIAAMGIPHCTVQSTTLYNYHIPKYTPIFVNLWSANHDPESWDEPELFRPERFLSMDCRSLNKSATRKLMAFGVGKRRCPGEQLAQLELFLLFSALMHQCSFEPCQGEIPELKYTVGLSLTLQPYKVYTTIRKSVGQ
ncbi:cytochrome P450 1B1-like [Saccoglossus kowalevskii]|uniref:Cytochrome P450 1B1-like n=1 Tax=Saccoglossus kowalevskii TaxID=10224 RepID=A0ABM0GY83_SACKO|nr:PREDICTED: cytochrome P450 1B1-like [Saccoglossus kowalevskii]